MLILHAARQVVEEEGFDEMLDNVRARIDEIESLHRTRELTVGAISLKDFEKLMSLDCSSRTSTRGIGFGYLSTKVARFWLKASNGRL
jgi:hypothetical protein